MKVWGWAALFAAAIFGHFFLSPDWGPYVFGAAVWITLIYIGHKIDDLASRISSLESRIEND